MGKIGVVILTIITCLFGEVHSSFAKEYYVSKIGKDASTCITSPGPDSSSCRTIMYVVNNATLVGGDTVYLQAGTYDENVILTSADSGSSGNYVTFKSYQNNDVIITTTSSAPYATIEIYDAKGWTQYIKFDGSGTDNGKHLRVTTSASDRCFMIRYAKNIWLTNLIIDDAVNRECIKLTSKAQSGVSDGSGARNCLIEYCDIHNGGDFGIKLTGFATNDNIIRYNDIHGNGGRSTDNYGLNFSGSGYESDPPKRNKLYNNNIYSNYSSGINILYSEDNEVYNNKFYSNGTGDPSGRGLSLSTAAKNNLVYNNESYSNAYYGISVEGVDAMNNKIYNNLIYNNGRYDLLQQSSAASNVYYNNTVYNSGSGWRDAVFYLKSGSNTIIKNNIVWRAGPGYAFRADFALTRVDMNNFYLTGSSTSVYYLGSGLTPTQLNNNYPLIASGNIGEAPNWDVNYRPTASSPQGVGHVRDGALSLSSVFTTDKDGVGRPQGSGWDMGAYEFLESSAPLAPKNLRILSN